MALSRHFFVSRGAPPPLAHASRAARWRAYAGGIAAGAAVAGVLSAQQATRPFDLLITNARIVDGTGGPSIAGSVAVRDRSIAGVGAVAGAATRTIDAGGKVIAPGFIDAHSHSDYSLLVDGSAGFTITMSAPSSISCSTSRSASRSFAGSIWCDLPSPNRGADPSASLNGP